LAAGPCRRIDIGGGHCHGPGIVATDSGMNAPSDTLTLRALPAFPIVQPGDDLAALIGRHWGAVPALDHDVIVVAQKVVSKAEGRLIELATVQPSARALDLAAATGKDPRLVEIILGESVRVVRHRPGVLIVQHRLGPVLANAGVDQSNVPDGHVLLWPQEPDTSAEHLRAGLAQRLGAAVAVVINDSLGRAWRRGTMGIAIGAAGLPALLDLRGQPDLFGRPLQSTVIGLADEIAAAASLLMGQAAEGRPVIVLRGLRWSGPAQPAVTVIRPPDEDLFR
jgi:coenzyme F420-0:L-glutamate ligase/coenzyme F420-1:gamma-L-glutamate ligase